MFHSLIGTQVLHKLLVTMSRVTFFNSMGPHTKTNTVKKYRKDLEEMKANGPGRSKFEQGRNSLQWAKHVWLYSDLLQGLNGEHLSALGSQQRGH